MKTTVRYRVGYNYHPFDNEKNLDGEMVPILYRETITDNLAVVDCLPVAVFKLGFEGRNFERFIEENELFVIKASAEAVELFDNERILAARTRGESEETAKQENKTKALRRKRLGY